MQEKKIDFAFIGKDIECKYTKSPGKSIFKLLLHNNFFRQYHFITLHLQEIYPIRQIQV